MWHSEAVLAERQAHCKALGQLRGSVHRFYAL